MRTRSMGPPTPPAVLLGGGIIAVAVARSLGAAGVHVHALGDSSWDTVSASKYCTRFVDLGSREGVQERWLTWLERGPQGAVLLPCGDDGLELVARNRARLVGMGYVPVETNDDVALAMLDKERTYALARRAGVPTPRTMSLADASELAAVAELVGFPCALKPRHSHRFARHFGVGKKLFVVRDRQELEQTYGLLASLRLELLATELIPGPDDRISACWTYVDAEGSARFRFTNRKLRQNPPRFGIGCYRVATREPDVAEMALQFCRAVGVRGLASVEFKRDPRDGELKLMECNQRFTTATQLLRAAGLEVPLFVYRTLLGGAPPDMSAYRVPVYLWYPIEDARSAFHYISAGELTAWGWARSLANRQHFPLLSRDDPGPAIASYRNMSMRALRKLAGFARRRSA